MFIKKSYKLLFVLVFAVISILTACSNSEQGATEEVKKEKTEPTGEPTDGGTVTGALDTAPGGMFNPIFYVDLFEESILEFTHESLVNQNEKLEFIPSLAEKWEVNDNQTEITFHLKKGVKWHDGEEFSAHDVVFTYQTMSDPNYVPAGGLRTLYVKPLLGYEDYNAGKTKEFEGVVAVDDYTVTFKFAEPNINPLYYASFPIIPKHVFASIPVSEMPRAPESLDAGKIVGTGPFKFSKIIEREQYVLERHSEYWQGKPHLDSVVWKVIESSVMIGLLEKGEVDFVARPNGIPAADFELVQGYNHIQTIEQTDFSYQVLGFKLNHRTADDVNKGVINPENWKVNEKIADPKVRQAIAYAINREGLVNGLLYGLGETIDSPIAPQFWAYNDSVTTNYTYDTKKAAKLLDEAGYIDKDGDGFREDPKGDKWSLNLNYPTGNKLREKSAPFIKQLLEEVGIKIELKQPKEMTAFLEDIEKDNNNWDLYLIGWGLESADPDPSELWSIESPYNYSRWNNKESDQLIKNALTAPDAFDQGFREKVYADWQKLYSEDLPALLLYAESALWAYNTRLGGIEVLPHTMYNNSHKWWVNTEN